MNLGQASDFGPALVFSPQLDCLVFAWTGSGNDQLNIALSATANPGSLGPVWTSQTETSSGSPALGITDAGVIFIAWKGSGNDDLSIAQVEIDTGHAGVPTVSGLSGKTSFLSVSDTAPGLYIAPGYHTYLSFSKGNNISFIATDVNPPQVATVSNETTVMTPVMMDCAVPNVSARGIFIAWVGSGNGQLNVQLLTGGSFYWGGDQTKYTSTNTTYSALSIAYIPDRMFLAWRGIGNNQLNVMREDQWLTNACLTLTETTDSSPALCSYKDINGIYYLALAWKSAGASQLNFMILSENLGIVAQDKQQWKKVKILVLPDDQVQRA